MSLRVVLGSSHGEWSWRFPKTLPKPEKGFASLSLFTPRRFAGWFGTDGRFTPLSQRLHLLVRVMRKRENIRYSQGGGSWHRITSSKKKSAANVTEGWHIYPPVIYCICWRATRFFDWPLRTTLPLFAPPRSTGLVFPVSAGFVNFPANVFSYVSPCCPSAPFVKRQRHRRLTSAAFGDIIKLQNRRGGSLPKGR